jgi:hypothetical protein
MRSFTVLCLTLAGVSLSACQTINSVVGPSDEPPKAEQNLTAPPATTPAPAGGGAISTSGSISGMSADRLRSLWGEPTLKRPEKGAELWQYSGTGGCTLLLYVYGGAVTHAEALPGGANEAAIDACAKASGKPSLRPVS